ncbi:MAG: peptidase S8 [Pedobacter sp.]|nr:MAG: peptidase S8 [Pedobacter sp.]
MGLFAISPFLSFGQSAPKPNWFNLDLKKDSVFGVSAERAYNELLKGKKGKSVIVAVLDGGVDYKHEDLKRVMWVNLKEKAGNGIDDDKNGYVDDIHGWNFLGGKDGSVEHETLEVTRLVRRDMARFAGKDIASLNHQEKLDYEQFLKNRNYLETELGTAKSSYAGVYGFKVALDPVVKKIGKENPTLADFEAFLPSTDMEGRVKGSMLSILKEFEFKDFYENQILEGIKYYDGQIKYNYNLDYDPRNIVGEDPNNSQERYYGNADVKGPDAGHGTHVAGIIGADRTNSLGIKGVADQVLIMGVRNTPNGDERDKDVANAIRYAVDNGAKVINMSFGKSFVWDKAVVDEAVKYAVSKDVLIVQAAGNENKDIDVEPNYPSRIYLNGEVAKGYITVGASSWENNENLKADFSNYGKNNVDVFAPGVKIYSTIPENKYKAENGTSMAAPVVAGVAALIRSYYPTLTAVQVKEIILKSVTKVNGNVSFLKKEGPVSVPFSDLSVSGGIVNAYEALKLASTY